MRILKKTLMFVAMLLLSIASFAIPANRQAITVTQPNGKTLTFILQGDERVNWATTLDGYALLTNKEGHRVYAVLNENGDMVASNVLACNAEERTQEEINFLSNIQPGLHFSANQVREKKSAFAQKSGMNQENGGEKYPTTGVDSLLVILVAFNDLPFTYTNQNFVDMTSQSNYHNTGSVKDYYLQQSDSLFTMAIRVVGPYTLPNSMAYYGNNNSYTATTYFVRDAINAADPDVDFSHYDNDGDGKVDGIHIIFAGTPESSTGNEDEIWPHRGQVNNSIQKDGVRFTAYSCSAEKRSAYQMDNIGTICHEFGHVLGLPDNYDTDYEGNGGSAITTGDWDLMCQGSYNNNSATPPYWSTGEKILTNWISVVDTLDATRDSIYISTVSGKKDTCYYIQLAGSEFFLIEARRKTGWDAFIPGQGLLIYHGNMGKINSWVNYGNNSINVNPNDRGWFVEPADGVTAHGVTAAGAFPGSTNTTYFAPGAPNTPSLVNGTAVNNVAITDIHFVNDSTLMFNYNSNLPMVTTGNATNIGLYSFDITGEILYPGSGTLVSKGVVISENEDFTFENGTVIYDNSSSATNISLSLDNLERNITYYCRAFVVSTTGLGMGLVKQVTTRSGFGNVATQSAQSVDSTSATLRGNMTSIGMGEFVAKGFVYTTDAEELPELDNATNIVVNGSTTGAYSYNLTGLEQGTTYYYRAYVTNTYGTYYGMRSSFTTLYPPITNNSISANQEICYGSTPNAITGTNPGGAFGNFTYLWQQKSNSSTWADAEGVNNQANYQPSALTETTSYRRVVYSDGRVSNNSNIIIVTVVESVGGSVLFANDTVEQNTNGDLTLSGHQGNIVDWEISSDNGNNYTSLNSTANPYNASFSELGDFLFRARVQKNTCPEAISNAKKVTVVNSSSIADVETINFSISPNPSTNGTFTISADKTNADIIISNVLGQKVYEERNANLNNKTISLDVENGSYIITIKEGNAVSSEKLIINK